MNDYKVVRSSSNSINLHQRFNHNELNFNQVQTYPARIINKNIPEYAQSTVVNYCCCCSKRTCNAQKGMFPYLIVDISLVAMWYGRVCVVWSFRIKGRIICPHRKTYSSKTVCHVVVPMYCSDEYDYLKFVP